MVTVAARAVSLLGLGVNTASPVPEQGNRNADRIAFTTQYAVNVTGTNAPCCADGHCCIGPGRAEEAQRSGGNLRPEGATKIVKRSIAPSISPV